MNRKFYPFNPTRKRTEMQARIDFLTLEINNFLGLSHKKYEVIRFKTSRTAGKLHTIKVKTPDGVYLHLKVMQPPPMTGRNWTLQQVRRGVSLYTPI